MPLGLRLVRAHSYDALPWMWGINGATSVLGTVTAACLSMAWGITLNLYAAALLYASLAISGSFLARSVIARTP